MYIAVKKFLYCCLKVCSYRAIFYFLRRSLVRGECRGRQGGGGRGGGGEVPGAAGQPLPVVV